MMVSSVPFSISMSKNETQRVDMSRLAGTLRPSAGSDAESRHTRVKVFGIL